MKIAKLVEGKKFMKSKKIILAAGVIINVIGLSLTERCLGMLDDIDDDGPVSSVTTSAPITTKYDQYLNATNDHDLFGLTDEFDEDSITAAYKKAQLDLHTDKLNQDKNIDDATKDLLREKAKELKDVKERLNSTSKEKEKLIRNFGMHLKLAISKASFIGQHGTEELENAFQKVFVEGSETIDERLKNTIVKLEEKSHRNKLSEEYIGFLLDTLVDAFTMMKDVLSNKTLPISTIVSIVHLPANLLTFEFSLSHPSDPISSALMRCQSVLHTKNYLYENNEINQFVTNLNSLLKATVASHTTKESSGGASATSIESVKGTTDKDRNERTILLVKQLELMNQLKQEREARLSESDTSATEKRTLEQELEYLKNIEKEFQTLKAEKQNQDAMSAQDRIAYITTSILTATLACLSDPGILQDNADIIGTLAVASTIGLGSVKLYRAGERQVKRIKKALEGDLFGTETE